MQINGLRRYHFITETLPAVARYTTIYYCEHYFINCYALFFAGETHIQTRETAG